MSHDDRLLRQLPPVHLVLDDPLLADAIAARSREAVKLVVRQTIESARQSLRSHSDLPIDPSAMARLCLDRLKPSAPVLRKVINATGVVLNTGLGRAPLAQAAIDAIANVATGYCNLEFDLERGERGQRSEGVATLLRELVGAEATAVVNNNAAATILALRALAGGHEVIVSRGQLVEIGGSFRLPEIFETAGVRLVEVGTTNKTRLSDYARAITPETRAILRVHTSNYRIVGFTESALLDELVSLSNEHGVWTIDDIGSGAIDPSARAGIEDEPDIQSSLAAGAHVVLCSGDKLLGGPQCGLIVGQLAAVSRIKSDPMMRAFRVDKLTLAALEATLQLWRQTPDQVPLRSLLNVSTDVLQNRAHALADDLRAIGYEADATETVSTIGGGSVPGSALPSWGVRIQPAGSDTALAHALRMVEPAIVGRIHSGAVILDLRSVFPNEDMLIREVLNRLRQP